MILVIAMARVVCCNDVDLALAASLTGEIRYMDSKFVIVELSIFIARVEPGIQALAGFFQYFDTEQV